MPPSQPWTAPLAPLASEEDRAGARLAGGRGAVWGISPEPGFLDSRAGSPR